MTNNMHWMHCFKYNELGNIFFNIHYAYYSFKNILLTLTISLKAAAFEI